MKTVVVLFCLGLVGCASGHCRSQYLKESRQPASSEDLKTAFEQSTIEREPQSQRVKVFKLDGSKQCEEKSGVPLAQMERELDHVRVYSSSKGRDSKIYSARCGAPTGRTNVFEIDEADLTKAQKHGFQLLTN